MIALGLPGPDFASHDWAGYWGPRPPPCPLSKQNAAPKPKSGSFCENWVDLQSIGCALLQALQYLPISNVLSVTVDEVSEVGQENEKAHTNDTNPDIQGSASPGPMDTSVSGKKLVFFPESNVEEGGCDFPQVLLRCCCVT